MNAHLSRSVNLRSDASVAARLDRLISRALETDGQPPFNEASLLEKTEVLFFERDGELVGAAMTGDEVEFVVDPAERRRGYGEQILRAVLTPTFAAWAHGDHPAARVLAERYGLRRDRTLLQLRLGLDGLDQRESLDQRGPAGGLTIDTFRPGVDDAAWVALNARAFAGHPEQGAITLATLQPRLAENPAEHFLLARDTDGGILGYCWLKIADDLGEIYVLGVDPDRAGSGIGRALLAAGLAHLKALGIGESNLYVEADNEPAMRLYRAFGYTDHMVDVLYRR
ncbi:mycothiol synthase [Salinibacterium sp. ZJ450]|uniref:mycothiol synthase n=1 Tax=Salinibacterium sp. ZJ450 TaxID=2708338 RepID=UPI00141E6F99|nr:mycothiol synthase [Salinibacterium sp. ZJ450]